MTRVARSWPGSADGARVRSRTWYSPPTVIPIPAALVLAAAPAGPATETQKAVETLRLDTRGLSEAALVEEIELRIPTVKVRPYRAFGPRVPPGDVYVRVRLNEQITVTSITADGRAFDRRVDPGSDPAERVAAATVANLVFALEDGRADADRTNVRIPPRSRSSGPRDLDLGISLPFGLVLAPGRPKGADVFAGWLGGVGLVLRSPAGGYGAAEFAVVGRQAGDVGIARFRMSLGGGWSWRLPTLEVLLGGLVTAEPWFSIRDGEPRGGSARTSVLLGAQLRLAGGYRHPLTDRTMLRVGPWFGLGGAFAAGDGAAIPMLVDGGGRARIRAGGFELQAGVEFVVWVGRFSRRPGK